MGKFQLPEDGAVLVIDENVDEAMPLIKLLSKQGIASIYLSGKDLEMPEKPLTKIRLAFIDIQLFGPTDPESHAQKISKLLDTIIPKNNGPYIAVIWTTTSQTNVEVLTDKLKSAENGPIDVFPLSKSLYFETAMDDSQYDKLLQKIDPILKTRFEQDDLDTIKKLIRSSIEPEPQKTLVKDGITKIADELKEKIKEYETFHLLTYWENLVRRASGKTVNSFSSLYPTDEYWQENLKTGIYRLAHAQLEKTIDSADEDELIRNALKTINQSFLDIVESDINDTQELSTMIKLDREKISLTKKIAGDEYKIIRSTVTNKFKLLINASMMPIGKPKETKNIEDLKEWGGTADKNTNISALINVYRHITLEINTKLLVDFPKLKKIQPGIVYRKTNINVRRKRDLLKSYYNKNAPILNKDTKGHYKVAYTVIQKFIFIELEITPLCDYIQGKWIKSRLLPGVLIPEGYDEGINDQAESIYNKIPVIIINKSKYKPVFNYHLLKSNDIENDPQKIDKIVFRAKKELCNDIISRLASHANRVGIVTVE